MIADNMCMRQLSSLSVFFLMAFLFVPALPLMAARTNKDAVFEQTSSDPDRDNVILEIEKVTAPYERDGYAVFTAEHKARYIGIAFDFERFSQVHSFNVRNMKDEDGKVRDTLMFYVMKRPKGIKSFSYRLVIDGLWGCDPHNDDRYYDENTALMLSRFTFETDEMPATEVTGKYTGRYGEAADSAPSASGGNGGSSPHAFQSTGVRFVLKEKSGQKIRISGSFTNWDPYIYEMKETSPGLYEMHLPLPPGTYYYTYYSGMKEFIDRSNPNRAYTKDGRTVSVITVE